MLGPRLRMQKKIEYPPWDLGQDATKPTKPVFRVSDKVRLKPVSSATETS